MKLKLLSLLILFLPFFGLAQKIKILIVASNVNIVNGNSNGTYFMELAIPFNYFIKQGFEVDIVSPKGGAIALYHKGDMANILKQIASDSLFLYKTKNSLSPDKIEVEHYSAIVFPGGYGHFWDVYANNHIALLAANIYESGGIIASLGHGTADLLHIKLKSGEHFVKGKTMTCFPTWVEKEFMTEADFGRLLPIDMQNELINKGAILKVCTKENRKEAADTKVVDSKNRLVTAAFADAGEFVASEICKMIKAK